jgi:hypothetical protein
LLPTGGVLLTRRKDMPKVTKSDGFTTFVFSSTEISDKTEEELKAEMKEELSKTVKAV